MWGRDIAGYSRRMRANYLFRALSIFLGNYILRYLNRFNYPRTNQRHHPLNVTTTRPIMMHLPGHVARPCITPATVAVLTTEHRHRNSLI
jgi:hypothetical protein